MKPPLRVAMSGGLVVASLACGGQTHASDPHPEHAGDEAGAPDDAATPVTAPEAAAPPDVPRPVPIVSDAGSPPEAGTILGPCGAGETCPEGAACFYPIGSCAATPVCYVLPQMQCASATDVEACDGGQEALEPCFAYGYATAPSPGPVPGH